MSDPERNARWRACFPTFLRGRDWLAQSPPVRWLKHSWGRAVKWALVALLIGGAIHLGVSVYTSSMLSAKLDALEAAKRPVHRWDLKPPGMPEGENAAPLYAAAAAWVRLHERAGGWDPSAPSSVQRALCIGYRDLLTRDGTPRSLTPRELECLRRLVTIDQPALDLIREGARRPHCQFERDWYQPLTVGPHERDPHQLLRFLAANVLVDARSGQDDLALECLRLGFTVGRQGAEEPTVIAGLGAARGTAHTMMTTAAHVLPRLRLTGERTRALADEVARVSLGATLPQRWNHERLTGLYVFGALSGPDGAYFLGPGAAPVPRVLEPMFWRQYAAGVLRPCLAVDEIEYLDQMARWDPVLAASVHERWNAWRAMRSDRPKPNAPWWAPVTRLIAWGPVGYARVMDSWDVSCDLLRVVLGLERYRQQHGRYPDSLRQLRATGWDVPKDRFSEAEFVYKPRETTFLLYSVGPNLRDDGGEPRLWPFGRGRGCTPEGVPEGDIVWEYRRDYAAPISSSVR
jgi:hypothetical protein